MVYKPLDTSGRLQLSYCFGGTETYEPGEVLGPRLLHDYEAVLIIDGFPVYTGTTGSIQLEPGSILVARPGVTETYRWDTRSRTRHAYLHFNLETVPTDWPIPAEWPPCRLKPSAITGQLLRHIIERAVTHTDWPAKPPGPGDNRMMEAFLDAYIAGAGIPDTTSQHLLSEPIRRAVKFMREKLDSSTFAPFTLDELATAAHVTPKHLCRAFQHQLGLPPMKACRLMQFQLAIPLLARSNLSIKAISERCGFPDQLHFTKSFCRAFGKSPTKVRDSMRQGKPPPPNPLPPALMPRLYW